MQILLTAILVIAAALATVAPVSAKTLGDQLDSGEMSDAAFRRFVAKSGVSEDEARLMTVTDIAEIE